jgi:hypothetical protein
MPYATRNPGQAMGTGGYIGELYEGPDGQLYEYVAGVDGLGNPIGFLKKFKGGFKSLATGALKVVGNVLVPPPLRRVTKQVCNFLPQVGPVVSLIPDAKAPYAMANRFCGVLRKAGIAGPADGIMEAPQPPKALLPNLSRTVPAPVRSAAKVACQVVGKLSPIARYIPPVRPYASGAATLCRILQETGIAEGPDGQLYEVVEGIGESGEVKRYLRPVWLSIPAVIRRRGARRVAKPAIQVQSAVRAAQPVVPVAPVVPARRVAPVRRFR